MAYEIISTLGQTKPVTIAPTSEAEEIIQNVQTIISTVKGTVPLDRAFGISEDVIDLPIQVAQAKLSNEIFDAIKKYEPRVTIEAIDFFADPTGKLSAKVVIDI